MIVKEKPTYRQACGFDTNQEDGTSRDGATTVSSGGKKVMDVMHEITEKFVEVLLEKYLQDELSTLSPLVPDWSHETAVMTLSLSIKNCIGK